jgi:ABC-2 type transport system ATP-binding protein
MGSERMQVLPRVGAFVESPSYYPHLTGRENLEVTRRLRNVDRTEVDRVLGVTRITKAADRPVKGYSLGMRQRLGVALALIGQPELLLLDEPTNGLDPAGIQEIRELMRELGRSGEVTVFVSSHLLGEVEQIATQVGIVHEGRLRYQGSPHGLQGQGPVAVILRVNRMEAALQTLIQGDWRARATPGGEISVEVPGEKEAADAAAEVNALLTREGFAVSRLYVTSDSLEDRFLRLTAEETESPA